jgi:putative transposase
MPRRQRLQVAGLPVHIIQRGNNRQACFFADEDYQFFLDCLVKLAKRFRCALHAYVLMTNHFHLLLSSELEAGPSLLMKFLGQRYVLGCYRYIEMNPVRANMVKHPLEYPWSSYAANADGKYISWVTPHGEHLALGLSEESRQAVYRGLFASELDQQLLREIRISTHGGYAIGSGRFREEIETALKLRATPRGPGRPTTEVRL